MALDKATLKTTIKDLMVASEGKSKEDAQEDFAQGLSDAIDVFVKGGTVNTAVTTPDTINGTGSGSMT